MPVYYNSNSTVAVIGDLRIEPLQSATSLTWFNNLPTGVTRTSVVPSIDPIIYSEKLTSTGTVAIPATYIDDLTRTAVPLIGNYTIRIWVSGTGDCTVQFNTSGAVARQIGTGELFEYYCSTRTVDSVIITISSANVYVNIEKGLR